MLFEGKLKVGDLNIDLINQIFNDLSEGAQEGWGNDWNKWGEDAEEDLTKLEMQQNLYKFSHAKSVAELQQINDLAVKYRNDYAQFKKEVEKVNSNYNRNYLQAEFQTARQAYHHGRKWVAIERDKDLFPNLQYRTVGDDHVREEHRILEGIIKPVDDPFWDEYYPPNGWRCRCTVTQTGKPVSKDTPEDTSVKPEFRINVGKSKEVYSGRHPYFALVKKQKLEKAFEKAKEFAPKIVIYKSTNGSKVRASIFRDTKDFQSNFNDAKIVADNHRLNIEINAHLNGRKNPEFTINKVKGDAVNNIKSHKIQNAIKNGFDDKFKKGGQLRNEKEAFIIFNVSNFILNSENLSLASRVAWSRFQNYKNIDFIIFIHNKKSILLDRSSLNTFNEFETNLSKIAKSRK